MLIGERSTIIECPIEDVFQFVSDPTNDPTWHPPVIKVERTSAGPNGLGSTFAGIHDPRRRVMATPPRPSSFLRITAEIVESVPNERCRIQARFVDPPIGLARVLGRELTLIFRVEPAAGGTRLFRSLDINPAAWLAPLVRATLSSAGRRRNDYLLANIKTVLEA